MPKMINTSLLYIHKYNHIHCIKAFTDEVTSERCSYQSTKQQGLFLTA